jgi:hypothetical protein
MKAMNSRDFLNTTTSTIDTNFSHPKPSKSKKKAQKIQDHDVPLTTEDLVPPDVRQAKEDLMRLGIELDDELISRLQNNLGVKKIFKVAHHASNLLAPRPELDILNQTNLHGYGPQVSYRHVSNSGHVGFVKNTVNLAQQQILQPFLTNLVSTDSRHAISILRQLENRTDTIEPQYRPLLEQMIQTFRVLYTRAPSRFIGRLLGRKWNNVLDKQQEEMIITKWILKNRFVTQKEFITMIQRVAEKHISTEVIIILFMLLQEEKGFANQTHKHQVVDLWSFLTLLKTASEESRRSYDSHTSKVATEIEFWKRDNAGNVAQSILQHRSQQGDNNNSCNNKSSRTELESKKNTKYQSQSQSQQVADGWRIFELDDSTIRHPTTTITLNDSTKLRRASSVPPKLTAERTKNMSEVLSGAPPRLHPSQTNQGRSVLGCFHTETVNTCTIPMALHAQNQFTHRYPNHYSNNSNGGGDGTDATSSILPHDLLLKESQLPLPPATNDLFDSRSVAYLLNNQAYVQRAQAEQAKNPIGYDSYGNQVKRQSYNLLNRELINQTTVASALGKTSSSSSQSTTMPPPPPSSSSHGNENASSLSTMMANKFSSERSNQQQKLQQKKTTAAITTTTTGVHIEEDRAMTPRRMRFNSAISLHWEDGKKPSVALALGHDSLS